MGYLFMNNFYIFAGSMKTRLVIILLLGLLIRPKMGFTQDLVVAQSVDKGDNIIMENARGYFSQVFGFEVKDISFPGLYETIADWLGTPYCYFGKSPTGIDCSGFVSILYHKVFQKPFTGSSAEIFTKIKPLGKSELAEGDLVFFRIRKKRISHVGIYLGSNKFAHASTSNGVIISDLDEPYYKKYFVRGGRVLADL